MAVSNWENPVLSRELRQRMRGSKAFWLLFAFVGVLALMVGGTYYSTWRYSEMYANTSVIGRQFFSVLFMVQAGLVCLITPALTSGALTLERENHTFEAMEVSLLPRRSIVAGKLASAMSFVLFLLSASLPLTAMTFLLGGVAPQEMAVAYLVLAVSAFVYGSLGLAFSSFVKSTVNSTLVSYFAAVAVFLLTGVLTLIGSTNLMSGTPIPGRACLVAFNPMGAIGAATMSESYFGILVPSWLTSLVMNGFLGTLFFLTALHRLEYPRSDQSGLLRGLLAGFVALVTLGLCGSFIVDQLLGSSKDGATAAMATMVFIGPVLSGLFATGSGVGAGGWFALRLGEAKSGLTFATLTTALGIAIASGTIAVVVPTQLHMAVKCAAVALAGTFGIAGLGLAISAWSRNRWVAIAITIGMALLLYGIPLTNVATLETPLGWKFSFLSPLVGALSAIDPRGTDVAERSVDWHSLWMITTGFYAMLGIVGITVAQRKVR